MQRQRLQQRFIERREFIFAVLARDDFRGYAQIGVYRTVDGFHLLMGDAVRACIGRDEFKALVGGRDAARVGQAQIVADEQFLFSFHLRGVHKGREFQNAAYVGGVLHRRPGRFVQCVCRVDQRV